MKTNWQDIKRFFNTTMWVDFSAESHVLWRGLVNTLRVSYIVIRELMKGELNLRAMSLVFTTLLSLVPLLAVAFSVLKAFGVHNQIEPALMSMLAPLDEKGAEITENIIAFVQNVKVGVLGGVGVAMLFYTIISLVKKVEDAFNFVWRVKRSRSFARRFTDYLSVIMIGPVLVFSALGVAATVLNGEMVQHIQAIEPFGTLILLVSKLMPYVMIILAFTFMYTFIPNTKVNFQAALIGAAVAGILWITLGSVFASFVASSNKYTAIYSSFAILFFFMIWLYLGWFILLIGSQVAFYLQHPKLISVSGQQRDLSARFKEQAGLKLMTVMAQQFQQATPALRLVDLERDTGLPGNTIEVLLEDFIVGGYVTATDSDGGTQQYVPAKDIANITVAELLHCLRTAEEGGIATIITNTPQVIALLEKINMAQQGALGSLTLRELSQGENNGR